MQELNQSLFFAISRVDFELANKNLMLGANPNSIYQISKGKFCSSFELFIWKVSEIGSKKGINNSQYRLAMDLARQIINRSNLKCKCSANHKCPLYIALQAFKITKQQQILQGKCDLVRFLIINGATIKYSDKPHSHSCSKKWNLKWFDLQGIRTYLITKNFQYVQTKYDI